jgi:hypothetical protein
MLSSRAIHRPSYFTRTLPFSFSLLFLLAGFDKRAMQICGDIMGSGSWESIQGPLVGHQVQLSISFGGISFIFMEDYAPFYFLKSWVLMVPYMCSKFHIFDIFILEEYVFQVDGGPHFLQSYLHVV